MNLKENFTNLFIFILVLYSQNFFSQNFINHFTSNGRYNTTNATLLTSCTAGSVPPPVNDLTIIYPDTTINLNLAHTGTIPTNCILVWYKSTGGAGLSTSEVSSAPQGEYNVYYYDVVNGCYSPKSANVVVSLANNENDSDNDGIPNYIDLDDDNDGILDEDENCKGIGEYADWVWNGTTSTGTGNFDCSNGPDFTYSVSNYNSVSISNNEVFDDSQQSFETIYGQADNQENLVVRTKSHAGSPGVIPLVNYSTITINFNNSTSIGNWAFAITDLDADQIQLSAFDANNNPVPNDVINYWLKELFDTAPLNAGVNIPFWDASNAALVGSADADGIYNTMTQIGLPDEEAPGGWFEPNISIKQLTLTFSAMSASNTPSCHIYIASRCCDNDTDGDGIPDHLDLDSDNDGCPDAIEGNENVSSSHLNPDESINIVDNGGIDANGVPNLVNAGGDADTDSEQGQDAGNAYNAALNSCKNYWVGTLSSEWETSSNWAALEVPFMGQDIEFATMENNNGQPAINNLYVPTNIEKVIGNLTNQSDNALIIPAGSALVVNGNVIGSETNASKIVVETSSNRTTPNGSLIVDCVNNSGRTVKASVQLYAKGFKNASQTWTDNIAGSPTYGQTFTSSYRWQHFGVPVASVVANPTFYGSFLREYSEPLNATASYYNKWINLSNSSSLTSFKGYAITQEMPKIITIIGDLVFCNQEIVLTRSAAPVVGSTDPLIENSRYGLGQNVIGNSFTAAIPIDKIDFENILVDGIPQINDGSLVEKTVYLYNTGSFGDWTGSIQENSSADAIEAGSYRAIPSNVAGAVYNQIPSMQGFLLRHTGQVGSEIRMTLPYGELTKNSKPQTAPSASLSFLEVELNSASTVDKLWLFSVPGTSPGFDNGWDGRKYFGTPTAFIYVPTIAGNMQVSTTDDIIGSTIAFLSANDETFTISVTKSNFDNFEELYLIDLENNVAIKLEDETTHYHFDAKKSNSASLRFIISDKPETSLMNGTEKLLAYSDGKNIFAYNKTSENCILQIFDISGRMILTKQIPALSAYEFNAKINTGFYLIKLITSSDRYSNTIHIR